MAATLHLATIADIVLCITNKRRQRAAGKSTEAVRKEKCKEKQSSPSRSSRDFVNNFSNYINILKASAIVAPPLLHEVSRKCLITYKVKLND